jgi:hypothetical protein
MGEEQGRDDTGDGDWVTVSEAARRLGISPRAIRGRILRRTIEWKAAGNAGRLVLVRSRDVVANDPGDDPGYILDQLREELMESKIEAARAEERAAALRELVDELRAELAAARRPWWRRLIG